MQSSTTHEIIIPVEQLTQDVEDVDATGENDPTLQPVLRHTVAEFALTLVEYVPEAHPVHVAEPALRLNVPALQDKHKVDDRAPIDEEYVPAGQTLHAEAPTLVLYVPALQLPQEPDAAVENVAAPHVEQTVDADAPTVDEYIPALQIEHVVAPAPVL